MSNSVFASLNQTPGPGAYKPESYQRQGRISYSMARKYDDRDRNKNPGPGSYKQPSFAENKKPMSFPKQMKDNILIEKARL